MLEVKKNQNESTVNLLRRFRNKIKQANILPEAKANRFNKRRLSAAIKKKQALKKIERLRKIEYQKRWGLR